MAFMLYRVLVCTIIISAAALTIIGCKDKPEPAKSVSAPPAHVPPK